MKNMGVWSLELYGVKNILSTNRAESFNSLFKRPSADTEDMARKKS